MSLIYAHDLFKYKSKAIEKILLKAYVDTEYFVVILSKAFLLYTSFGDVGVDGLSLSYFFLIYLIMRLIC